jgi:predicted small metal-binding protein
MSQAYENCIQLFCIRCEDVGLDCSCTIYGINEETVVYNTILHMFEYHAIRPVEMTTCMRLKIIENVLVCTHYTPLPTSPSSYNNHFSEY